ncbi:MAG: pyridoxamine 5'-phosphate oxidase family protein [Tissierellia bacterium]|nr:pyridoxamine 5'-phosphate oxidase family protein [Tissierellia bacterium]
MLSEIFYECIKHDGIVAIASCSKDGQAHVINTWNKYLIVTDDEKILIPAFGMRKTETNVAFNPHIEITIGSHEVQGKMGLGAGCLLTGTAIFQREGDLFETMHKKCSFANRVIVFSPDTCKQTI